MTLPGKIGRGQEPRPELRRGEGAAEPESRHLRGRVPGAARLVGLRQVHAAQLHRRPARHHRRPDLHQGQERHLVRAEGTRHRHGVPVLRALSADDAWREPLVSAEERRRMPKAEIEERVARAAKILQIEPLLARKPARSRAASASASPSAGRWCAMPTCSCSTSRSPTSTPSCAPTCGSRSRSCTKLGNTMIYVTHDQIEAMTLADRIAIMKGGKIQQLATPHEIYNRPRNLYVAGFIGSPRSTITAPLRSAKCGFRLINILSPQPTAHSRRYSGSDPNMWYAARRRTASRSTPKPTSKSLNRWAPTPWFGRCWRAVNSGSASMARASLPVVTGSGLASIRRGPQCSMPHRSCGSDPIHFHEG
jgi:hypothetical protein